MKTLTKLINVLSSPITLVCHIWYVTKKMKQSCKYWSANRNDSSSACNMTRISYSLWSTSQQKDIIYQFLCFSSYIKCGFLYWDYQHVNDDEQLEKNGGPNFSTTPVSNYPKPIMLFFSFCKKRLMSVYFSEESLAQFFSTRFSPCLTKPRSKPFSVCPMLLSEHRLTLTISKKYIAYTANTLVFFN